MQTHIGTKIINAEPMTRGEYNKLRGWEVPADENPDDAGYLVEYTDGGKANHPNFKGYISWSPADVFERAYRPIPAIEHLPPHQQRVVIEKAELDDKIGKLAAFIATFDKPFSVFGGLPEPERMRLYAQHRAMVAYSTILAERIAAF